jgi:hypothetical protein
MLKLMAFLISYPDEQEREQPQIHREVVLNRFLNTPVSEQK